jgi:dihydrofolate synthase / folylpolyglutamate synthase
VGLYTSPHLVDVRERIVVNGKKIPPRPFSRILAEINKQVVKPVTYFEVLTAAAFIYFQKQQVDIAVMEVGLGGRLDATNVCIPLVSVITNIGLEHTAYLGKTLTAIAGEKAGIVKPAGVCVTGVTQQKVVRTLTSVCRQRKSALYRLGKDFKMVKHSNGLADYQGMHRHLSGLAIPLPGEHQLSNAALALAALEIVEKSGLAIGDSAIHAGLQKTHWEARMEILSTRPLFLLDGAHNLSGINALFHALQKDFSWRRLILIFAALADKDYEKMLRKMAPLANIIILPPLTTGRAIPPHRLACKIEALGCRFITVDSVGQAVRQALEMAGHQDMVCAAGSLYLAGEVKQAFHQMHSYGKA